MIHLRQHVPDFVSGVDPLGAEIETTADALVLPWVKQWEGDPGFFRWVQSPRDYAKDWLLMAEFDGGKKWWVVGRSDSALDLPEWVAPKN